MDDVQHVRHTLGRMVDVALQVHKRRLLLEDAVPESFRHRVDDIMHVLVAFSDIHVIADTDDVRHEGNHIGSFTYRLAMSDLALLLIQILYFEAEQIAGRSKAEARACGIVAEQADAKPGLKHFGGNVILAHVAKRIGHGKYRIDLVIRLLPGQEEVIFIHLFEIKFIQLINISLKFCVHIHLPNIKSVGAHSFPRRL